MSDEDVKPGQPKLDPVREAAQAIEAGLSAVKPKEQRPEDNTPAEADSAEIDWSDPQTITQLQSEIANSDIATWSEEIEEDMRYYEASSVPQLVSKLRAKGDRDRADLIAYRFGEIEKTVNAVTSRILVSGVKKLQQRIPSLRNADTAEAFAAYLRDSRGWNDERISRAVVSDHALLEDCFDAWRVRTGGRSAQSLRNAARRNLPASLRKALPPETASVRENQEFRSRTRDQHSINMAASKIHAMLKGKGK